MMETFFVAAVDFILGYAVRDTISILRRRRSRG